MNTTVASNLKVAQQSRVNVAPSSVEGHFVEGARVKLVDPDDESFTYDTIEGEAALVTANHGAVPLKGFGGIVCQKVSSLSGVVKSLD